MALSVVTIYVVQRTKSATRAPLPRVLAEGDLTVWQERSPSVLDRVVSVTAYNRGTAPFKSDRGSCGISVGKQVTG